MKPNSTARFIMYDLRPSKQIERKLVFDTIGNCARHVPDIASLPFIGMGGFRFVDFLVANKAVSTSTFISIEHDSDIVPRCEYNKPFTSITVRNESVHDFLISGGTKSRAVVWLDYESGLTEDMLDEIQILTGTIPPGSFVFVTCKALPDRSLRGKGQKRTREYYQDQLGTFALNFPEEAYSKNNFPSTAARLLRNILADGFSGRSEGEYLPYLRLIYSDSNPMATVGGYFGLPGSSNDVLASIDAAFPFLRSPQHDFVYDVGDFNLTEGERRLFNRAALAPFGPSVDMGVLHALGFGFEDVQTYRDLMRYVPRYFEAYL
jgi:hypothetical protein